MEPIHGSSAAKSVSSLAKSTEKLRNAAWFHQASRCRCGCSITYVNELTGACPGVTFHFPLGTRGKEAKGNHRTSSQKLGLSSADGVPFKSLPTSHKMRGLGRQRPESPSHKLQKVPAGLGPS